MNKISIKAGILILILVAPALFFFYLKLFATNHFRLPYFYPEVNDQGKVMLQGKDTIFHKIPTFKLIDKDGTPFTDKNLTEKIYVANFFSTNCTTICPKMTHQLERVQAKFIKNKDVNIVSYSIDTKNDSPQVLKAFAIKNEAIANKWHFVTGDKTALFNLALNGYKLAIADAANYDKKISEDKADIHSEKLLLIDKSGYIRGIYNGTRADDVDRLIVEMQILLDIYQKKDE